MLAKTIGKHSKASKDNWKTMHDFDFQSQSITKNTHPFVLGFLYFLGSWSHEFQRPQFDTLLKH